MLIVSVHDVAPSTEADVRRLLARLDEAGIERRVLKVVPHENGVSDLRHQFGLIELLREEVDRGSEVVLHGWTHQESGPPWGSSPDVARARLFGGGRAELMSVGDAEVGTRVRAGFDVLAELGLTPRGFCAPGWLARAGLSDISRDAGLDYLVWWTGIEDLRSATRITAPATGYLGVEGVGEDLHQVGGLLSLAVAKRFDLPLRIVLHPQGAAASPHAQRAIELAGALRRHRPLVTYAELVDAHRQTDAVR